MIELKNFSKRYSKKTDWAVEKINLKAENGKITALLGPNGAGKTTIIKAVCANHYPTEGCIKISFKDKVFDVEKDFEKVKNVIGYVPETIQLDENLSVIEFLDFCLKSRYREGLDYPQRIKQTIETFSLHEILSKNIKQLSKGWRQRLVFAQSLIHDPENIVLDEPVNGLDPAQILQFRNILKNITKEKAILISTHLMQEVTALCDVVYILNKGKISAYGSPKEIIAAAGANSIEEAFLKITGNKNE